MLKCYQLTYTYIVQVFKMLHAIYIYMFINTYVTLRALEISNWEIAIIEKIQAEAENETLLVERFDQ